VKSENAGGYGPLYASSCVYHTMSAQSTEDRGPQTCTKGGVDTAGFDKGCILSALVVIAPLLSAPQVSP
jgi:hypothetical protein